MTDSDFSPVQTCPSYLGVTALPRVTAAGNAISLLSILFCYTIFINLRDGGTGEGSCTAYRLSLSSVLLSLAVLITQRGAGTREGT